jgi:hypothetical protein
MLRRPPLLRFLLGGDGAAEDGCNVVVAFLEG